MRIYSHEIIRVRTHTEKRKIAAFSTKVLFVLLWCVVVLFISGNEVYDGYVASKKKKCIPCDAFTREYFHVANLTVQSNNYFGDIYTIKIGKRKLLSLIEMLPNIKIIREAYWICGFVYSKYRIAWPTQYNYRFITLYIMSLLSHPITQRVTIIGDNIGNRIGL